MVRRSPVFSDQIERLAEKVERLGTWLAFFFVAGMVAYLAYKYVYRQLLLRELRMARITAEELKQMMDNGQELLVVDLRGALRMTTDELAASP